MLLLVTDTSGKRGSVALARATSAGVIEVLESAPLAGGTFSAQLVPQIAALLAHHQLSKTDIDAFVVASGPGSFTGLRVGLAAIKALAEILHKPIVPVSLLEVIAAAGGRQGRVLAALDAGRNEVYAGEYEFNEGAVQCLREALLPRADFVSRAREVPAATPDPPLAASLQEAGLLPISIDPPSAFSIANVGLRKLQSGEVVTPEQLEANYIRRTDAEIFSKPAH